MKYQVGFKHVFCLRLFRSAYVTFLKTGCKYQNVITSGIYRTHHIYEIINPDTCQSKITLPISMRHCTYKLKISKWKLCSGKTTSYVHCTYEVVFILCSWVVRICCLMLILHKAQIRRSMTSFYYCSVNHQSGLQSNPFSKLSYIFLIHQNVPQIISFHLRYMMVS